MKKLITLSALVAAISSSFATAIPEVTGPSTGEVKFNGLIAESCNLQNFSDGIIVANVNQTTLNSTASGGSATSIMVRTNSSGYNLFLGTPHLYLNGTEIVNANYVITGSGTGTDLNGVARATFTLSNNKLSFDKGIYTITINAEISNTTGAFEAGSYQLRVPVTCAKSLA